MTLLFCYIENYGSLSHRAFSFENGITEFCRPNGAGKTTLASFVKAMFYGLPSARKGGRFNARQHYYPFGGGKFGGNITFEKAGKQYKVERFFDKTSGVNDSLSVYCNGTPTDSLGTEIGRNVFGLDEESFERLLFISAEDIDICSTGGINAKLNQVVDNTDRDNNFESAIAVLDKKRKELKAARGNRDLITEQQEKIRELQAEIENLNGISAALDAQYEELGTLNRAIHALEEQERAANEQKLLLQKWETYDSYAAALREEERAAAALDGRYPHGLPLPEELARLRAYHADLNTFWVKRENAAFGEEKREQLLALSERFEKGISSKGMLFEGIPSEDELKAVQRQISEIRTLKTQIEELAAKAPEGGEAADAPAQTGVSEMPEKKNSGKGFLWLAIIGVIIMAAGVGVLFVQTVMGVVLSGAGILVLIADGFLYLKGQMNELTARPAGENEALRQLQKELAAQKEEALKSRQEEYQRLLEKTAAFFDTYALPGEVPNDLEDSFYRLKTNVDDYERLQREEREANDQSAYYAKQYEDTVRRLEEILSGYEIKISENLAEQLEMLEKDRNERNRLEKSIAEHRERAEACRAKNGLTTRPEGETPDLEALREALSAKRNQRAALDGRIGSEESLLEGLSEKQNRLAEAKEVLEAYKTKHRIYMAAIEALQTAEQSLKDKYIAPVKDRLCHYSGALEAALGEKIMMDKDFRISFERAGENRSDRHLSAGERSICALCFRLALIDNMYGDDRPFIVMDDPFVHLDAVHMEKIRIMLGKLAAENQMIYFCCHEGRRL